MARSLGQAGAVVHINGRSREPLEAAAARLAQEGLDVRASAFDVANEAVATAALADIQWTHGRLDILVNNVGARLRKPLAEISGADFAALINTDLVAAFSLSKVAAEMMAENGYGRIINVTSTASLLAYAADPAYIAAKGGLAALTRALACEYSHRGVNCNALCPGTFATETNMAMTQNPTMAAWFATRIPVGRVGRPEEIGPACLFLAAPASSFVSGMTLVVDGGVTASVGKPIPRRDDD
jgi:gluconate 5-dehydrogenase